LTAPAKAPEHASPEPRWAEGDLNRMKGALRQALRLAALTPALALCAGPAAADPPTTTTLIVDSADPLPSAPMAARRGRQLIVLAVRAPRAVRLGGDVDAASAALGAVNAHFPLTSGQVLLGYEERPGTYCTPVSPRGLGMAGPCLIDTDRDGRFDAIVKAGFNSAVIDQIVLTASAKVVGVQLGAPAALSAAVPYAPVAYGEGHSAAVRLNWSANNRVTEPNRPVDGSLWLDASARFTGTGIVSRTVPFHFEGQPVTVTIGGIAVRILGFDGTRSIRYQIVAVQGGAPVEFAFRRAATTNYIVIYR
jgi:hypothetical protein